MKEQGPLYWMQTILPNSLNQPLRSSLVVFFPQPFTQTSGFRTRVDMLILLQLYSFNPLTNKNKKTIAFPLFSPPLTNISPQLLLKQQTKMNNHQSSSTIIPNIYELHELPFLKKESSFWTRFKDKQKFLPLLRGLTFRSQSIMPKMFLFMLAQSKNEKKLQRYLHILTERQILPLQQLYQLLNENSTQIEFSIEVQRLKTFQKNVYSYVNHLLAKELIGYRDRNQYLSFNVYKQKQEYYVKAFFKHYQYRLEMCGQNLFEGQMVFILPEPYTITNPIVKKQLNDLYVQIQKLTASLPLCEDLTRWYKTFYDDVYFLYDEFVLKLQVFHNFPLLRIKNYIPVKFTDYKTGHPLQGPIFSSSNPECMYNHFSGYNAESTKMIEREHCQSCQIFIEELQQNQLLMMLRDNIFNPNKSNLYYCPQFNRFKIIGRVPVTIQQAKQGELVEEQVIYKTILNYLNYYHFRINLKKMSNKQRISFNSTKGEEAFPLTFRLGHRSLMIMDPARGRGCQHHSFTDLRLYYLNYDPETNTYKCPIEGCHEKMVDSDILYLKEVSILINYAKFKCEEWPELTQASKVVIDNSNKKLYVSYRIRDQSSIVSKMDELVDFYKTLVDPYIVFPEYRLGIRQKERKERMDEYMFGGLREQMNSSMQVEEEEDDEENE